MKNLAPFIAAIMASGLVAACRVGPNYHRPVIQSPTAYRDLSENPQVQAVAASYADLPWWQVFQDPQLQELIRIALKQNYDLQLATERINAGRAQVAITRSNLFPQVQGSGDFTGGKEHTFQTRSNFLTLTSDAAFQLDFFGKLRRATEASRAQLLATEDARQTVILTLVSDVASDYFALLQLDLQLQITRETVKTQKDSVKLTNLRVEHGVATKLDVLQAQQVLDSANAQIPDLERRIAQEENAISILLGNYPQAVPRGQPLVEQPLPPEVPPGLPSSLIERRPDIREAEQTLVTANAEIGVAKAQFFPQISLTGSGGGSFGRSSAFSGLMSSQLGIWSYGARVSQPIRKTPSRTCRNPCACPKCVTREAPPLISKSWMANGPSFPPSSHSRRRAALSTRVLCNCTGHSAEAGSNNRRIDLPNCRPRRQSFPDLSSPLANYPETALEGTPGVRRFDHAHFDGATPRALYPFWEIYDEGVSFEAWP